MRDLAATFLNAVDATSDFWKFRMATEFHEWGHLQEEYWKARYILWCSALESIYTSGDFEHRGSLVAKERIKWFLGVNTNIYEKGDLQSYIEQATIPIGDVIDGVYAVRNFIAHGDRIPDEYFQKNLRRGLNGDLNCISVYLEAVSFIIRKSLLKIMQGGLLPHFRSSGTAEAICGAQGLTRSEIRRKLTATRTTGQP